MGKFYYIIIVSKVKFYLTFNLYFLNIQNKNKIPIHLKFPLLNDTALEINWVKNKISSAIIAAHYQNEWLYCELAHQAPDSRIQFLGSARPSLESTNKSHIIPRTRVEWKTPNQKAQQSEFIKIHIK